jgi:hypothetical protein
MILYSKEKTVRSASLPIENIPPPVRKHNANTREVVIFFLNN